MYVMRFPKGKAKALTLSYDDASQSDRKMIEILDKYNIKCTFNVNSALMDTNDWHIGLNEFISLCKIGGHEIACHGKTHPRLELIPPALATDEVLGDRLKLEEATGEFIRGMAYPYGTYNDTVVEILKNSGIVYSRTTQPTNNFALPCDWLRLNPTCHHDSGKLGELTERFLTNSPLSSAPWLFYLWGHSFEFDRNDNWNVLENFCEKMSNEDDVWYATNIEIYDYITAFNQLIYSADGKKIYNPTAITLYLGDGENCIEIPPDSIVKL